MSADSGQYWYADQRPPAPDVALATFPNARVVQVVAGDPDSPLAVVEDVVAARVTVTASRIVAHDGECEWSWHVRDDLVVVHGHAAAWSVLSVPGIPDFGVAVADAGVAAFRRVVNRLEGAEVRHQPAPRAPQPPPQPPPLPGSRPSTIDPTIANRVPQVSVPEISVPEISVLMPFERPRPAAPCAPTAPVMPWAPIKPLPPPSSPRPSVPAPVPVVRVPPPPPPGRPPTELSATPTPPPPPAVPFLFTAEPEAEVLAPSRSADPAPN